MLHCYHSQDKFGSTGEAEYPGNSCDVYAVERRADTQSKSGGYPKHQTRNLANERQRAHPSFPFHLIHR